MDSPTPWGMVWGVIIQDHRVQYSTVLIPGAPFPLEEVQEAKVVGSITFYDRARKVVSS